MADTAKMKIVAGDWVVFPGGKLERGPVYVSVEGEKITAVSREAPSTTNCTPLHAHVVVPGFVDLHTHGVGKLQRQATLLPLSRLRTMIYLFFIFRRER